MNSVTTGGNSFDKLWNIQQSSVEDVQNLAGLYKSPHGMFAGVPILCKADKCPYVKTCLIEQSKRVAGQRCLMEAAAIISRFNSWCMHFGVDISQGKIKDTDLVDASLIRDLVDNEVQILRAENRIAISSDFISKTIATIDSDGKAYYEDTISPEAQYKLQLLNVRFKIMNLLNSTRKDKANELKNQGSPSAKASSLLKKIEGMLNDEQETLVVEAEIKEEIKKEE